MSGGKKETSPEWAEEEAEPLSGDSDELATHRFATNSS